MPKGPAVAPPTASDTPWEYRRTYTEQEQAYLKLTTWTTGYAPANHPRPESITDDDIVDAINVGRFRCGIREPIETEPDWNPATVSTVPDEPPVASTLPTIQAVASSPSDLELRTANLLPNILVPNLGMLRNKPCQQRAARLRPQIHHLHPILPQPINPAAKVLALAHHQPLEPELPHQP